MSFDLSGTFLSDLTTLIVIVPQEFTLTSSSSCISSVGSCLKLNSTSFQASKIGLSLSNYTITLKSITLPFFITSTTFKIVYKYNGYNVSYMNTGIYLLAYCSSPCQRCSTTKTACLSCLPSPNTQIYYDSSTKACSIKCSSNKYSNNYICLDCVSPCSQC
jgi:hypothetical protein